MPKHTTLNLLPGGRFPARTGKAQLEMYIVAGSTGAIPELCLRTEQVYHKLRNSAMGRCKHNDYQSSTDAVRVAVPPFIEVFL